MNRIRHTAFVAVAGLGIVSVSPVIAHGQTETTPAVRIGQPIGELVFPAVLNTSFPSTSLSRLKGKLVLLSLWSTTCAPCIGAMPRLIQLQHEFGDRIQILLVTDDTLPWVQEFYTRRPELRMPTAMSSGQRWDWNTRVGAPTLATVLWVDAAGILRGVTDENAVSDANIRALLNGRSPSFRLVTSYGVRHKLESSQPFMLEGNTGGLQLSDVLEYSVLTNGVPGQPSVINRGWGDYAGRRYFSCNTHVSQLFAEAFADSSKQYRFSSNAVGFWVGYPKTRIRNTVSDLALSQQLYCYDIVVQSKHKAQLYEIARHDLEQKFGVSARMEKVSAKVLALVVSGTGPKPSAGGESPKETLLEFNARHESLTLLASHLEFWLDRPVVNETHLNMHTDVFWVGKPKDLENTRRGLRKYGLDLQEVERPIDFLVLRNAAPIAQSRL